jgi:hypothetical protein
VAPRATDIESSSAERRAQLELLGLDDMIVDEIEPPGVAAVAHEPAFPINEALSRLGREQAQAEMEAIPVEVESQTCTCGMGVRAGARFCRRCGRPLDAASTEAGSRTGPPSSAVVVVSTVGSAVSTRVPRRGPMRGSK